MNYRTLMDDELQRLAHRGDAEAVKELGARSLDEASPDDEDETYDEGYESGLRSGRQMFAEELESAVAAMRRASESATEDDAIELRSAAEAIERAI